MFMNWFNAQEATAAGAALAEHLIEQAAATPASPRRNATAEESVYLRSILPIVDREAGRLRLNIYKRAKLAESFKSRLIENGFQQEIVEALTRAVLLRITASTPESTRVEAAAASRTPRIARQGRGTLLAEADACLARAQYDAAIGHYGSLLEIDPRNAHALNNLGAALCKLGRYRDAESQFRRAVEARARDSDAHCNLGTVLRWRGDIVESEMPLRRALKANRSNVNALLSLGTTLTMLGRMRAATDCYQRALRLEPRSASGLFGMGQVAQFEGRFQDAADLFNRALEYAPSMPNALAAVVWLRKMTAADGPWAVNAERVAASGITPLDESNLRFAIGKYYDDIGEYKRAFQNYRRANELQKLLASAYDRPAREAFVADLMRAYPPSAMSGKRGASDSSRPIFVVGMMRSGTSLVEQIIASHPEVEGAGELSFWNDAVLQHADAIRRNSLNESTIARLANAYLQELMAHSRVALRVVDKATVNSDYLGIIHSILPNARIIYVRRDPIDSCLSCYFQQFSPTLTFAMDLADLAHYYRQHRRLVNHWRAALPAGALLEVPYEQLIADQEGWTRRMLEFLGLSWNERCLRYFETKRFVLTASFWQVRQAMSPASIGRWRNYEKFIGPLRGLAESAGS